MDAIKISNDQLRRVKMIKARDHIDKVQEIVSGEVKTNRKNVEKLQEAMNMKNMEKTGVQLIFNYILTLFIFGWLFLLIAGILSTPGVRILYELSNTKFQHLRILLMFSIYTYFQVMNPYAALLQMIYIITIYMFFESFDFWSLITFNFKNFSMNFKTPLFWDEGILGILYRANIDPGFLIETSDLTNIDNILGNCRKLMEDTRNVMNRLRMDDVKSLFTRELGYDSMPNISAGDVVNSLIDTGNYIISQNDTPGLLNKLRPHNIPRYLQFDEDVKNFNILQNPVRILEQNQNINMDDITEMMNKEATEISELMNFFNYMGFTTNPITRSSILFYILSFLIILILIVSIIFSYDKVGFKMEKVSIKNKRKK
jgi:hypothetical protein